MKLTDFHETDGRRLRSHASRERIINAVIALIDESRHPPSAEDVAARAGVGLRSVFRHFGDMDTLYGAVLDRVGRRYLHLVEPYHSTHWTGQLREALGRRLELFEGGIAYRRAAEYYRGGSAAIRQGRDVFHEMMRARLESVVGEIMRQDRLWFQRLDLWLSLDCYASLRERQHLSHAEAAEVMTAAVEQLIAEKA